MMAGKQSSTVPIESFGNRQLWQIISGAGCLRPQEYIAKELNINKDKLLKGLSFYKKQSSPQGEALKKDRKVKASHAAFVIRLSQLLGLDELQSHDLFCAFLFSEYRGSQADLTSTLSHERHSQSLLMKISEFYSGERLYVLRCVRQMLNSWLAGEHAYRDVFATFLSDLLDKNTLGKKLIEQFDAVCSAPVPTKEINGPLMGRVQINSWAIQNLKEQVELLELLVIYYKDFEMDMATLLMLCDKFKKHGFGWGQSYKHLVDSHMETLVLRIGYLEILLLLEGLDILNALSSKQENNLSEHVILGKKENLDKLYDTVSKMGSEPVQSPIIMGCAILHYISAEMEQSTGGAGEAGGVTTLNRANKLGNLALQLGGFNVLLDLLEAQPFSGNSDLGTVAHYCVFSILSALLTYFQEDSLGNTETIYRMTSRLLCKEFISTLMWESPQATEGLRLLYESSQAWFPLDFACFTQLNISLAKSGQASARQVKKTLHHLSTYTELLDNNRSTDLQTTQEKGIFVLRRDKMPYQNSSFAIERNTRGKVLSPGALRRDMGDRGHVMRWEVKVNGWQMLMGEVQELLAQVAMGAGNVATDTLLKASMVMELVKEVMTSDPSSVGEFTEIFSLAYQLILRFGPLSPAPTELLSHCAQCLALAVPVLDVGHPLKQTGLLPFLTENIDDLGEVLSGDGVCPGLWGNVLVSSECPQGVYHVTLACLDLLTQLVQSYSKQGRLDEMMAPVLFVLREVFPGFHKWRYVDTQQRKDIGHKCLALFHKIFSFVNLPKTPKPTLAPGKVKDKVANKTRPSLQEACVFSLLFSEAGRTLLDIVTTGVDNIQTSLAQQCSLLEGQGMDLMELVEMSLSLLNRLLLLKPESLGSSPVEQALSSGPLDRQLQHPVATLAQYVYHRHSPRLTCLATLLLKRLATLSPMSILACLGSDANPVRDMYLTRLAAASEDIKLKVGILELLSVCVESQPGLIEIFLHVQQPTDLSDSSKDLSLGRSSVLPTVLDLMKVDKQCTYLCPPELLTACLDLVHALWLGMRETPMTVLRGKDSFWPSVMASLKTDLPDNQSEDDEAATQALKLQTKLSSFSLRIIAMELYATNCAKLNTNFKSALKEAFSGDRLMYWSKQVRSQVEQVGGGEQEPPQTVGDHPALNILLAWKNFLIVINKFKVQEVPCSDKTCSDLLNDLLCGIQSQFSSTEQLTPVKVKLASISSALYFTLTKLWGKELLERQMTEFARTPRPFSGPAVAVKRLTQVLRDSLTDSSRLLPSVHIGLLGALTSILQHCGQKLDDLQNLIKSLLPVVCDIFLQSSWQLPNLIAKSEVKDATVGSEEVSQSAESLNSHIKVQVVCCCLMVETLHVTPDLVESLRVIQEQGIVSCLLTTMEAFFKAQQGVSYIYSSLLLLIKMADSQAGANMLSLSNLTSHLCLALTSCYTRGDAHQPRSLISQFPQNLCPGSSTVTWVRLYCLSVELFSSLLRSLGHAFLEQALDLVGVHQDRMVKTLSACRVNLSAAVLEEAESTCNLLMQMCAYHREWRFQLPVVMARLMGALMSLLHTHIALLVRPRYLAHLLDHGVKAGSHDPMDSMMAQTSAIFQHQSSLDDVEQPTSQLIETQHRMLRIVSKCVAALQQFSPPLYEIILDQAVDVTEWEQVLELGFGTPGLESSMEGVTFGTVLACVTMCIRHLAKVEGKTSPQRGGQSEDQASTTIPRPVVTFALESCLLLLMSQACRCLRDPSLASRDHQFLKRELGTELNSFLSSYHRQLRRGDRATPPQAGATTPMTPMTPQLSRSASLTSFSGSSDPAYIRLVQAFVQRVLR